MSEGACHFLSKMSKAERLQKRRIRRRKNKAIEKEEQFMLDYVRYKYSTVYEEAAWVCKQLNDKYPEKIRFAKGAGA